MLKQGVYLCVCNHGAYADNLVDEANRRLILYKVVQKKKQKCKIQDIYAVLPNQGVKAV